MKIKFSNPYTINKNLLIRLLLLSKSSTKHSFLIKIAVGLIRLIVKRLAIFLLNNNKFNNKYFVKAKIYNHSFRARSTNSQFSSIYFPEYKFCYEPDVYSAIEMFLPHNGFFIDIGSNWGHHSFIACLKKDSLVFAFEPNPNSYNDIKNITNDLNLVDKVKVFNNCLGDKNAVVDLCQSGFESGLSSVDINFINSRYNLKNIFVKIFEKITFSKKSIYKSKMIKLDDFFSKLPSKYSNQKINLIKIDCEGYDYQVLKGAEGIIAKDKPFVIFEHSKESTNSLLMYKNFFSQISYSLYEVKSDVLNNKVFYDKVDCLENSKRINILASPINLNN